MVKQNGEEACRYASSPFVVSGIVRPCTSTGTNISNDLNIKKVKKNNTHPANNRG